MYEILCTGRVVDRYDSCARASDACRISSSASSANSGRSRGFRPCA
jgi:hypothetical protein